MAATSDTEFREVPDAQCHLCICLMVDAPFPRLLHQAQTDLAHACVQKGLQQAAYEQLRFPSQNRKRTRFESVWSSSLL